MNTLFWSLVFWIDINFQLRHHFSLLFSADINHCVENPCLKGGLCRNIANEYNCTCSDGYTGSHCDQGGWTAFFILNGYTTAIRATTLRTLDRCFIFIHPFVFIRFCRNTTVYPDMQMLLGYFTYRSNLLSVLVRSTNCRAMFNFLTAYMLWLKITTLLT